MMRLTWGSLLGLLAVSVLVAGATIFGIGLASASGEDGTRFGDIVILGIVLLGVPTAMLTLLLGGLALIYSRPPQERSKRVRRITLCLVGALFAPMGLWLFLASGGLSPLALIVVGLGVAALYVLGRDISRHVGPVLRI